MDLSERERIKQKRQQSAKVPHKLVPIESPIEVVISNLGEAWKSEELTRASFRAIYAASARATATFSEDEKKIIVDAAVFHEEVQDIQVSPRFLSHLQYPFHHLKQRNKLSAVL